MRQGAAKERKRRSGQREHNPNSRRASRVKVTRRKTVTVLLWNAGTTERPWAVATGWKDTQSTGNIEPRFSTRAAAARAAWLVAEAFSLDGLQVEFAVASQDAGIRKVVSESKIRSLGGLR